MSNVDYVQKQIKSFNKYFSRHMECVSDKSYEIISDLIGDNLTASGYGKAGKKFLESLSPEELLSYSSDIDAAKKLIQMQGYSSELIEELAFEDPKSGLWKMYQKLEDMGHNFDSEQVKSIVDGEVEADYRETLINMGRMVSDDDYGVSDFTEWFNSLPQLEV